MAPPIPITANGREAAASHAGFWGILRRTTELMVMSASASTRRSESAVVRTYVLLRPERALIIAERRTSPVRAGRKLLARYPAELAEKTVEKAIGFSALSRMRQRTARTV